MQMHPEMGDSALLVIQECFRHGTRTARSGSALALKACADELTGKQVTDTLDFLLGHGLADHDDEVRSQMVAAGDFRDPSNNDLWQSQPKTRRC